MKFGMPSANVIEEALAGLVFSVNVGYRYGSPAEDDHGEEEDGSGEKEWPEVGQDGDESGCDEGERDESDTENESDEDIELVLEEFLRDLHGLGERDGGR